MIVTDGSGCPNARCSRAGTREVGELANVEISSVSRVPSERAGAGTAMHERLVRTAEQPEYEPDFPAQSLRRGVTFSMCRVMGDISNP